MKKILIPFTVFVLMACGNKENKKATQGTERSKTEVKTSKTQAETSPEDLLGYASFGEIIAPERALSSKEMYERYNSLEVGDTLKVKFTSQVASVCKKKGCWMKMNPANAEGEQIRVTFKDYGFFVPKDIENKTVIVEGNAFLTEVSVEDLKHYAKDEGKSEAEIAAITEPEQKPAFVATGVLIKQ